MDNISLQGIQFVVGIILARLLSPSQFGLVGMITIFIAISQTFIESGLSEALIRKQDCDDLDYNTVFYFNLTVGIILFLVLFFLAPAISFFFNEPSLAVLIRVLGLVLIISSLGIVQRAKLTKAIDIKTQTKVSIISNLSSGILAIALASWGFGVWSLIWRIILSNIFSIILLWIWSKWRPKKIFSKHSFNELFSFGSKLLASGLLNTIFENIYYVVIGKVFSPQMLGYFSRAAAFADLPSTNINSVIQRVTYPVLATIQDDQTQLKSAFRRLIKSTTFISFTLMIGMAVVAKPLILTLIGEKWRPSIPFLQLLCFSLMLYPLHSLNLNILKVRGRSDLFLKLELIKKLLAIPVVFAGILFSIKMLIVFMIIHSWISFFLNSFYSGRLINYPLKEQIRDIIPPLFVAATSAIIVYLAGRYVRIFPLGLLVFQSTLGIFIIMSISEIIKLDSYIGIKQQIRSQFRMILNSVRTKLAPR